MGADEPRQGDVGLPLDTSEETHRLQRDIYLKMGGAARAAIGFRLSETIRNLAMAGIRRRHPGYTNEEILRQGQLPPIFRLSCRESSPLPPARDWSSPAGSLSSANRAQKYDS